MAKLSVILLSLPNARAYGESCRVHWKHLIDKFCGHRRMLDVDRPTPNFADVIERGSDTASILGCRWTGTLYCYRNPLV